MAKFPNVEAVCSFCVCLILLQGAAILNMTS